jgi:hypothetical protein
MLEKFATAVGNRHLNIHQVPVRDHGEAGAVDDVAVLAKTWQIEGDKCIVVPGCYDTFRLRSENGASTQSLGDSRRLNHDRQRIPGIL